MKKLIKWLLILGSFVVAIVVAAVLLIPQFVDVQSYKPEIEKKVSEATGMPFSLNGDLSLTLFPWVGVSFSDLALGNPEGFQGKSFVKISSFEARVKLMPLLSKEIEVKKFLLDGPEIYLERKKDGAANWEAIGKKSQKDDKKESPAVSDSNKEKTVDGFPVKSLVVGEFSITNGRLIYVDGDTKKEISDLELRLTDVTFDKPIGIDFKAMVDKKAVSLNGKIGPIGSEPGRGTLPIDIGFAALDQLSTKITGSVTEPLTSQKFDLSINVATFSPRSLVASLGEKFPVQTSDQEVLKKVGMSFRVKGDPASIEISDGKLILDDSQLEFTGTVKEMTKPDVNFALNLDAINLDRYLPVSSEKVKKEEGGDNKQGEPVAKGATPSEKKNIDYQPLRELVLEGEVKIGELIAHGAKIQNFEMKVLGKKGVFTLKPFILNLYKGSFSTVGTVNVQGEVPKTALEFDAQKVEVGPLMRDSMDKDVLEGALTAKGSITLKGDDPDMIKKTLNGKGELLFTDGAIVGIDIAGMVRNLTSSFTGEKKTTRPRTDFAELKAPFTMTNGLFKTAGTSLSSPLLRLGMTGDANLVTEALNFKVKPKFVGTLKGQGDTKDRSGITVPVIVGGTFSKPEYSPDLKGLVDEMVPEKEELLKMLTDSAVGTDGEKTDSSSSLKKQGKDLEKRGKGLLKGFGFD